MRVSTGRLFLLEVRGLQRSTGFRLGAAGLLVVATVAAALAGIEGRDGLREWLFVGHIIVPTLLGPVAAYLLSRPRSSRFTDALFTAPVGQGQHFAARALCAYTLVFLYAASLAPLAIAIAIHVTLADHAAWLIACVLVGCVSASIGLAVAALMPRASAIASASLVGGILGLALLALPLAARLAALALPTAGQKSLLDLCNLSPHVLAMAAAGVPRPTQAADGALAAMALGLQILGSVGVATWCFTRLQAVDSWKASIGVRFLAGAAFAACLAASPAIAGSGYEPGVPPHAMPPAATHAFGAMVPRGASTSPATFLPLQAYNQHPLAVGQANDVDLLVLLPVADSAVVTDIDVRWAPLSRGELDERSTAPLESSQGAWHLQGLGTERGVIPQFPPPAVLEYGRVARFAATFTPTEAEALASDMHEARFHVAYTVDGKRIEGPLAFHVLSEVPDIQSQLAVAGAPIPLALAASWSVRRMRTGASA